MRIALDCRSVFRGMGGIGRYAWSLLKTLAVIDQQNEYLCYFTHLPPPEAFGFPRRFKVRSFECGMIDERFDQLILPSLLQDDRVDVYHNPTFAVPVVRTPTRLIATIHDVVFKRHPELVEPRLREYLHRATLRASKCADRLITVSEFSRGELLSLYPKGADILVIHNGVDAPREDRSQSGDVVSLGLRSRQYVLYVGSIESKKNIDILLQAFARIVRGRNAPDLHLALAGSRNDASYPLEQRIAQLGLSDKVRVLGYVPSGTLEALYDHALMFVYPSLYEGFGFPPLEAMARGVPTIVSDASSLPEVVGDAALLFDPKRPELLSEAIRELSGNPSQRSDLARKGRQRAALFTWKKAAQEHLDLYNTVSRIHETASSVV